MTTKEEIKIKKEKKFQEFLYQLQQYLNQNPNHTGTISKTQGEIGRTLYTFSEIRKGKRTNLVFGEQHFAVLDKMFPGWDNYTTTRFNFDQFCNKLEIFTKAKHEYYKKYNVPEVLRDLHVPNAYKVGDYDLGTRVYRIKTKAITLSDEQLETIKNINPHCLKQIPTYDIPRFYIELRNFVAEKNKEYDKFNIPAEMRDYSLNRNTVIGDYKIGVRFRHFKNNWASLTKEQKDCFLELAPTLFSKKKRNSFNFATFFTDYSAFIRQKNKYYDKLETPTELRSYTIHKHEEINGEHLGEKLYYVKRYYNITEQQEDALNKINPQWREKSVGFDFGEFYGQLLQFRKQRDAYYNQQNVPQEKRAYTVFSSSYMGSYQLGINFYLIKTGKIKISDLEKEYLLKLDPTCLSAPIKTPTLNQNKKAEQEREI